MYKLLILFVDNDISPVLMSPEHALPPCFFCRFYKAAVYSDVCKALESISFIRVYLSILK